MSWIWGCMVLSFEVLIGGIFWTIGIGVAGLILTGIGAVIINILD